MNLLLPFCLFFFIYGNVSAWRIFHHGRMVGGNLGKPYHHKTIKLKTIPEKWFTQNLNHFNPGNDKTWNQVRINFFIQSYYPG